MEMKPTERIMNVIEGKELDRVQLLSVILDRHPVEQILGKLEESERSPINSVGSILRRIEASVELGFDAAWAYHALAFKPLDAKTIMEVWGNYYDLIDDGHGNSDFMYRGPAITSPEEYDKWPHFPDPDDWAHKIYEDFKEAHSKFGDKICICGECPTDLYDCIQLSMGFAGIAVYIRKDPDFIRRWVTRMETIATKTTMAMMDAGLKVILKSDDFCFKTGPQMNP